jgi:hypothetical protein
MVGFFASQRMIHGGCMKDVGQFCCWQNKRNHFEVEASCRVCGRYIIIIINKADTTVATQLWRDFEKRKTKAAKTFQAK